MDMTAYWKFQEKANGGRQIRLLLSLYPMRDRRHADVHYRRKAVCPHRGFRKGTRDFARKG